METTSLLFILLPVVLFLFYKWRPLKNTSYVCLVGKTALVTGAARGIGYFTALELASRGCRVIIADILDAEDAKKSIIRKTNNTNIAVKRVDLADLESVRKFANDINKTEERLDILINNAGIGARKPQKTKDGLDLVTQTNYFGPFLLTHLLADLLKRSAPSRIVFVASILSYFGYVNADNVNGFIKKKWFEKGVQLYANSKFCLLIAAEEFAERLGKFNVTSIPVRPFFASRTPIITESTDSYFRIFSLRSLLVYLLAEHPSKTAQHIVYVSVAQELEGVKGKFFTNSRECWKPPSASNKQLSKSIWAASEKLVGLKSNEKLT